MKFSIDWGFGVLVGEVVSCERGFGVLSLADKRALRIIELEIMIRICKAIKT